jgi:leader peptidase (prepilin peptidase)/N-methyltransferase
MEPTTYGYPLPFLVAVAFAAGACVGSFLNVVIARVPLGESIVWPPSHCTSCGTPIRAFHNVPIVSWFWLRGRCGNCKAPFSIRYAAIEAAFAVVCGFAVLRHGLTLPAAREIVMMGLLIPLTFMDLDHWLLPHALTWPGTVAGLLLSIPQGWDVAKNHLLAAAIGGTSIVVIGFVAEKYYLHVRGVQREAMGMGDAFLLALIGAFLGTRALMPVYLLASVQGVALGIPMLLLRRRTDAEAEVPATPPDAAAAPVPAPAEAPTLRDEDGDDWKPDPHHIPFGPALALAAAEILYFTRLPQILFPWPF